MHPGPQHEAMNGRPGRFPCGARTTGDPQEGGQPENHLRRPLAVWGSTRRMHCHPTLYPCGARTTGDTRG
eukprot:7551676-Pyramimonas_sp.AAC.1